MIEDVSETRSQVNETFTIPTQNLDKLQERIAKLNKRAVKLGVPQIDAEVVGIPSAQADERGERQVVEVQIDGVAPKLNGWQFIATLEHDEDGTIIRRIPTFAEDIDLSQYRDATPENCDHCGYKRRRNDTYIVAYVGMDPSWSTADVFGSHAFGDHHIGDTKQVGSNCLKDFTGHESPQQVARFLEQVRDLLEEVRGGGYSDGGFVPRYSTRDYMAAVVAVARVNGFTSKKTAWEDNVRSTADAAANVFRTEAWAVQEIDYEWADKVIAWAEGLTEDELTNDYLWNLHTVLKNGSLTTRQFGIAASGTQAYKRAQRDEFVGAVGQRVELTVVPYRVFDNEAYATYILRDQLGRALKWSTNVPLKIGAFYRGSFNVKAHDDSRYGKQTLINYPRDLQEVEA